MGSGTSFTSTALAGTNYFYAVFAADALHNYTAALSAHSTAMAADSWGNISTLNAPSARDSHSTIWTGSKLIIWGGEIDFDDWTATDTGAIYDPVADTWTPMSTLNAPSVRQSHSAVWTGDKMIVFGGLDSAVDVVDGGGIYTLATDTWTTFSTTNAPSARFGHVAIWTGTDMIIWGGSTSGSYFSATTNSGAIYNLQNNSWTATSVSGFVPSGRSAAQFVWTGNEILIWGGHSASSYRKSGARYNVAGNSWTTMSVVGAPAGSTYTGPASWTGGEMVIWGGLVTNSNSTNAGGIYNLNLDSWVATSTTTPPVARNLHCQAWTGSEVLIWGGETDNQLTTYTRTGARLNPSTNTSWSALSTTNAPNATAYSSCIWTGHSMIVWGGTEAGIESSAGGVYYP